MIMEQMTAEQLRAHFRHLRQMIVKSSVTLTDEDALTAQELFDKWQPDTTYAEGDRRRDEDKLYACIQPHTSQSDWPPHKTPALWKEVSVEEWPEWKQPLGSHDAYANGAKVSHNEKHWISRMDANVYEPGVYGWDEAL